jgi:hypothetical protein
MVSWVVIVTGIAALAAAARPPAPSDPDWLQPLGTRAARAGLGIAGALALPAAFLTLGFEQGVLLRGLEQLGAWALLFCGLGAFAGATAVRLDTRWRPVLGLLSIVLCTAGAWSLLDGVTLDVGRDTTERLKIGLAAGGALLALGWAVLPRRFAHNALVLLTLVASLNYARWGTESLTERLDAYDVLHYYINAKYFDELGYYDLYPAAILADLENDGPFFDGGPEYLAQDADGHTRQPIRHAVERGKVVKAERFTDERWAAFTHDTLFLMRDYGCRVKNSAGECRAELNDKLWRQLIQDHGYNGTTVWTMIAEPIVNVVPVEYVKWLGHLDVLLLGLGVAAVAWAYGGTTALFAVLWLATSYSMRWPYLSWVFLRYDWLAALMIATALLRKGKPLWAGLFAGWSAALRFFPAMWMWGPFGKGVAGLVRGVVSKPLLMLAAGFLLAVGVLQGGAFLTYGTEPAKVHFENMLDHNDPMQLSSRRIGLAQAISQQEGGRLHKFITTRQKKLIDEQKPIRYGVGLLVMLLLAAGLRRSRDDEAYAFGFVPFFLLTTASYYYYQARITLAVVHGGDLSLYRNRLGLSVLFALEVFSNFAAVYEGTMRMVLIGNLAQGLAIYVVWMLICLHYEAMWAPTADDAPAG